jgi:hypothetical protein
MVIIYKYPCWYRMVCTLLANIGASSKSLPSHLINNQGVHQMDLRSESSRYANPQNNGFFWAEEPQEDSIGDSDNDHDQTQHQSYAATASFFAQDPDSDNESSLHSFYQGKSTYQHSFSLSNAPIFSQLSQSSELSRMDESIHHSIMSQSSHRDAEVDRQRKKMERKRKRGTVSVLKKRRKYNYSERQIQRGAAYRRFRYEKGIDVSHEQDVGGSVEYLVRRKLNEPGEQTRLMKIANEWETMRKKQAKEKETDAYDSATAAAAEDEEKHAASRTKPNWDFLQDGYVTMPGTQAKNLSYYIYNISNQKPGQSETLELNEGEKDSESVNFMSSKKRTASKIHTCARRNNRKEIKWETFSIPLLQYSQLNPNMDLRSYTPMTTTGQDCLVLLHGRLARRVCARLVAGGANYHAYSNNTSSDAKTPIKHEDQASDISHSSDSSESFCAADLYGSQFHSQGTFGSTTVIGMDDFNPDDSKDNIKNQSPVMRLLSLVHTLPNYTHNNRFYIKIATELGTLRQYWENEFKSFFETTNFDKTNTSPSDIMALKSFFGVDGSISPGPFWCSDPATATDITRMYKRMQKNRSKLISRLRSFIKQTARGPDVAAGRNVKVLKEEINETDDVPMDDENTHDEMPEEQQSLDVDAKCAKVEAGQSQEGDVDFHAEPVSLLDAIELSRNQGDIDKYSKVVHEANLDPTNVTLSLSLFLNELTAAKTQLHHLDQLGNLTPLDQRKKWTTKDNIGMWNETIDEYLTLAENRTRPLDINLLKRDGKSFQCASLAQAVIVRQSYVSNGGGAGYKSKKSRKQTARLSNIKEDVDSDSDNDGDESVDTANLCRKELRRSGGDLIKRGKEYLTNDNLQLFTPIHLTTGLAILTEHMTAESTEMMARQCSTDSLKNKTPFELVRKALQYLEDRSELVSSPKNTRSRWEAKGKVVDEVLVSSWETAANIFRRCVKEEPHDVDNWSWYVSTLLGIVCVSSGETLSSDAGDNYASLKSEDPSNDIKISRHQLDHYDDKRRHAAMAIHDLINLADKIGCPMFHMAISNMLEWKQAICCTAFDNDIMSLSDSEVKSLYAHHVRMNTVLLIALHLFLPTSFLIRLINGRWVISP